MIRLILWGILIVSIIEALKLFFDHRHHEKLINQYQKECMNLQKQNEELHRQYQRTIDKYNQKIESLSVSLRTAQHEVVVSYNQLLNTSSAIVQKMDALMKLFSIASKMEQGSELEKSIQALISQLDNDISSVSKTLDHSLGGIEHEQTLY